MQFDRRWLLTIVCVAVALTGEGGLNNRVTAQNAEPRGASTLYSQLGGYDFIARFVDTAFPRVATNPQLSRLFRGHAKDSQMRQRQLIVDALCHAADGPCLYIGRDLTAVHEGLGITDDDWRVFTSILQATVQESKLPADTQRDFMELIGRFRPTVVLK